VREKRENEGVNNNIEYRWTRAYSMPYARNFHASTTTEEGGGLIFTVGGSIGLERTKTAATYLVVLLYAFLFWFSFFSSTSVFLSLIRN